MPLFLILFSILFTTGCGYFVDPLVSELASTSSENFFTQKQQKDMAELLEGILQSEGCCELNDAMNSNPTLDYLEEEYEVKDGFLYDELLYFYVPQQWTRTSKESYLARGIVTAWLGEKGTVTVKLAVDKVQACY